MLFFDFSSFCFCIPGFSFREVACYEGLVYGLWKPGTEQAEVLAATLASPAAGLRYHGSACEEKTKWVRLKPKGAGIMQSVVFGPQTICCPVAPTCLSFFFKGKVFLETRPKKRCPFFPMATGHLRKHPVRGPQRNRL